jgi:hypothetical protein
VVRGFPVLLSGCYDTACIRGIRDITQWLASVHLDTGRDIAHTRAKFLDTLHAATGPAGSPSVPASNTAGSSSAPANKSTSYFSPDPVCYNLISDLANKKNKAYFLSSSKPIPKFIEPVNNDAAMELLNVLINELNEKFLTELSVTCEEEDFEDTVYERGNISREMKFVVLGGSHASRIASSLDDIDLDVVDLSTPGWHLSEAGVHKLAAQLEAVLNEETENKLVVIYHLFDNSIYFGLQQDGSKTLPFRGSNGKYHAEGALHIADRTSFRELFNMAVPLLRAGGEECKVVLSPLLRYIGSKCCDSDAHIVNFGEKRYFEKLGAGLGEITDWMKELAHSKRIKNYKIMCPNRLLKMGEDDDKAYWDADPVHMCTDGYRQLTPSLLDKAAVVA